MSRYNQVWSEEGDTDKQIGFRHTVNITQCLTQQAKAKPDEPIYHPKYDAYGECSKRLLIAVAPAELVFPINDGPQVNVILSSFSSAHVCGPMSTWHI